MTVESLFIFHISWTRRQTEHDKLISPFDGGHFALEAHWQEIGRLILDKWAL